MNARLTAAIAGAVMANAATAQWTQVSPAPSPAARAGQAMASDAATNSAVMFAGVGGTGTGTYFSDTWRYDGTAWTEVFPPASPAARMHMDMVFDSARGLYVLYGGQSTGGGGALNQTWEFDGATWTQRTPATTPGNLCLHAMAFDSLRNRVVLYGGYPGGFPAFDNSRTWEYDGTNWTQRLPATNPGAREAMSMCFHAGLGRTILFGGVDATPTTPPNLIDNDKTWSWDGTNWVELPVPGTRPPRRERARMAYDSVRGVCVLTGGMHYSNGAAKNDTWELQQSGSTWTWTPLSTPTVGRYSSTLAFLAGQRNMVQFGGVTGSATYRGDTREYGAHSAILGAGCPGTFGVPALNSAAPRVGQSWTLNVSNMHPGIGTGILVIGFSEIPGGLDLGPLLGMPGCTGYASPDVSFTLAVSGGSASWSWTPVPVAFGGRLFCQAVCFDPLVNSFGATVTNALAVTVGN